MPRYPVLAKIATKIAIYLRSNRWHRVVEWGKKLGLRRVYEGRNTLPGLTREEIAKLLDIYKEDVIFVEKLTNRNLSDWFVYES